MSRDTEEWLNDTPRDRFSREVATLRALLWADVEKVALPIVLWLSRVLEPRR